MPIERSWLVAACAAASFGPAAYTPAASAVRVNASVAIATSEVIAGADVTLNILSQTNVLVAIGGAATQVVTSISVPETFGARARSGDEVQLPNTVMAFDPAGSAVLPNAVATSVGTEGASSANDEGAIAPMLIVVQFN